MPIQKLTRFLKLLLILCLMADSASATYSGLTHSDLARFRSQALSTSVQNVLHQILSRGYALGYGRVVRQPGIMAMQKSNRYAERVTGILRSLNIIQQDILELAGKEKDPQRYFYQLKRLQEYAYRQPKRAETQMGLSGLAEKMKLSSEDTGQLTILQNIWLYRHKELNDLIRRIPQGENPWLGVLAWMIIDWLKLHTEFRLKDSPGRSWDARRLQRVWLRDPDLKKVFDSFRRKLQHEWVLDSKNLYYFFNGLGALPAPLWRTPTPEEQEYFQTKFFDRLVLGMAKGMLGQADLNHRKTRAPIALIESIVKGAQLEHAAHDRNAFKNGQLIAVQPPRAFACAA